MSLTYWGAQYISSGLISVLFGLTPLVTSLMAVLWLDERALAPQKLAGMGLGVLGLAGIFAAGQGLGGERAWVGMGALLLAVTIYSASLVWVKRIGADSPALATTAGGLGVSLPFFALVWALAEGQVPDMGLRAEVAILYLGVFGSVLGFALYYFLIKRLDAGRVSLITLVTPVLALLLGSLLNGEQVPLRVWLGTACIGIGLSIYQWESLVAIVRPGRATAD
jgi:drug/metabolite transporter (DMT)-like permease